MATLWFVITGALLIGFALAGTVLKRLPVTPSMFYLTAGAWLGPWGVGLLHIDALDDTGMLRIAGGASRWRWPAGRWC
jgi:NhaP-type Na+/H+ or K+/H+ antiporter